MEDTLSAAHKTTGKRVRVWMCEKRGKKPLQLLIRLIYIFLCFGGDEPETER